MTTLTRFVLSTEYCFTAKWLIVSQFRLWRRMILPTPTSSSTSQSCHQCRVSQIHRVCYRLNIPPWPLLTSFQCESTVGHVLLPSATISHVRSLGRPNARISSSMAGSIVATLWTSISRPSVMVPTAACSALLCNQPL